MCQVRRFCTVRLSHFKVVFAVAAVWGRGHMPPPDASREGAPKEGCGNILRYEMYKYSVSSAEAGMGIKGQIMCIQQCTFLDVISSISKSSKCTKIAGGWAVILDPTGRADSAPQTLS